MSEREQRNYGIELLRLLLMLYVVIIHLLMRGGVLEKTSGAQYDVAYLLKCITYCAVNCFVIISGYVGFSKEPKRFYYSKFIRLWTQVVTYSFGIQILAVIAGWDRGLGKLLFSGVPILSGQYWYMCSYAGLFVLMPQINELLSRKRTKESICLAIILFMFFSVFCTAASYFDDSFGINQGFSVIWFVVLYVIGAVIRKSEDTKWEQLPSWIPLILIVTCTGIMWIVGVKWSRMGEIVVSYNSPFEVTNAVGYLWIFKGLTIHKSETKKIIGFWSSSAFSVYLIHMQPFIKTKWLENGFVWIANYSALVIPFLVVGIGLSIFLICLIIDKGRELLFNIAGVQKITKNLEKKLNRIQDQIMN